MKWFGFLILIAAFGCVLYGNWIPGIFCLVFAIWWTINDRLQAMEPVPVRGDRVEVGEDVKR